MCGIFGYVGKDPKGIKIVLDGLSNLLHRGYDSIGICIPSHDGVEIYKKAKKATEEIYVEDIEKMIFSADRSCHLAFGHTRWATCGKVTDQNAHPHQSGKFVVVQNGNVENFHQLKLILLEKGFEFKSETDTEVIAHLFTLNDDGDLISTAKKVLSKITGANALVAYSQDHPDKLLAINRGGTLLIGKGTQGVVVVSDPLGLPDWVDKRIDLEDNEAAILNQVSWEIHYKGAIIDKPQLQIHFESNGNFNSYETFMLKEIMEQDKILRNAISGRLIYEKGISKLGGLSEVARNLRKANAFHFIGCGTAYYACQYAVALLNRFGIAAQAWISSEFCYSHPVFDPTDVFIFISQSGETADSIAVLDEIKIKGNLALGLVNVAGSKIARMTDAGIYIRAGVERGVASTKAFTAQLVASVLLALFLARQRKMTLDTGQKIIEELEALPDKVETILGQFENFKSLASQYQGFKNYYFLGRYFNFITAQEGALKLKEISYVHAEAYPLGEMKHGPLALVEPDFCSLVIVPQDSVFAKSLVNISEILARKGRVIAVSNESSANSLTNLVDDLIVVPTTLEYFTPILSVIPLQLFAYYMATELGKNPDKPRNLAKTVTVE